MWLHYIRELISDKLKSPIYVSEKRQVVDDPEGRMANAFTRQFQNNLALCGDQILKSTGSTPFYFQEAGKTYCISLYGHEIRECFDRGMAGPLALAKEKLEQLAEAAKDPRVKAGVVVAGGGLRTESAKEEFRKLCPPMFLDEKEPRLKFTDDFETTYRYVKRWATTGERY